MEYIELAKYVFSERVVDWNMHNLKCKRRQLVLARQISIYLANWFWPQISDKELASLFDLNHASSQHAFKTIKALLFSDQQMRKDIDKYLIVLKDKINSNTNQP